jgi:transposase
MTNERRERRHYSDEFKGQITVLYESGKAASEIIKEYDLTPSTFHKWVKQNKQSSSFKHSDNLTAEQLRIKELEKQVSKLQVQNDILKQAALILGTSANGKSLKI